MTAHATPIVIVGAGLAGASVAFAAARRGLGTRIHVFEREPGPGRHATAQNAAMVRALLDEDVLAAWGSAGTLWWNALPAGVDTPGLFRRTGSVLLAEQAATRARLEARVAMACRAGLEARMIGAAELRATWPMLEAVPFTAAAHVAEDGVADPVALAARLLADAEAHGATVHYDRALTGVVVAGGRVRAADFKTHAEHASRSRSSLEVAELVLASGAWAPEQLRALPADDRGLAPWRRHLALVGEVGCLAALGLEHDSPFFWHVDRQAYFRPESGAVLTSVCDVAASLAGQPKVASDIDERLHARLAEVFPFLLDLPLRRTWAGLRTYRPSHDFVLGAAEIGGLHLACGLGGHGVTCVGPIGEAVARGLAAQ